MGVHFALFKISIGALLVPSVLMLAQRPYSVSIQQTLIIATSFNVENSSY